MLDILEQIWNFGATHQAALTIVAAWIVRDWAVVKSAYPAIVANGGVLKIIGRFFYTPKQAEPLRTANLSTEKSTINQNENRQ